MRLILISFLVKAFLEIVFLLKKLLGTNDSIFNVSENRSFRIHVSYPFSQIKFSNQNHGLEKEIRYTVHLHANLAYINALK